MRVVSEGNKIHAQHTYLISCLFVTYGTGIYILVQYGYRARVLYDSTSTTVFYLYVRIPTLYKATNCSLCATNTWGLAQGSFFNMVPYLVLVCMYGTK